MYLKLKKKKIQIRELKSFWERFKGLKFVLEPIDYGVCFPHKKFSTTNFLCQRIDIVLTDKDHTILYLQESVKSEKYIFPKRKVYYTYFLPLGTAKLLQVGKKMPLQGLQKNENKVNS